MHFYLFILKCYIYLFIIVKMHKGIIEHEKEIFLKWLSNNWEENCKNRRLNIIPHVEDYIKSACNVRNSNFNLQ